MKIKKGLTAALVLLLVLVTLSLCACSSNQSGSTIDEPDITVDYLKGEYADQLLRDGAEHVFGTIDIKMNDDGTAVDEIVIHAKEYVEDANYETGYYIADKNKAYITHMPDEARTTYVADGSTEPKILPPSEFIAAVNSDYALHENDIADFRESKLYDFYLLEDQILLVLAY